MISRSDNWNLVNNMLFLQSISVHFVLTAQVQKGYNMLGHPQCFLHLPADQNKNFSFQNMLTLCKYYWLNYILRPVRN